MRTFSLPSAEVAGARQGLSRVAGLPVAAPDHLNDIVYSTWIGRPHLVAGDADPDRSGLEHGRPLHPGDHRGQEHGRRLSRRTSPCACYSSRSAPAARARAAHGGVHVLRGRWHELDADFEIGGPMNVHGSRRQRPEILVPSRPRSRVTARRTRSSRSPSLRTGHERLLLSEQHRLPPASDRRRPSTSRSRRRALACGRAGSRSRVGSARACRRRAARLPDCELAERAERLLEPGAELGEERRVDRVGSGYSR